MSRTLVLSLAFCTLACPSFAEAALKHPKLHRAVSEMRQAHQELEGAGTEFGGHRARGALALQAAFEETERALKSAGEPYEESNPPPQIYAAYPNYPHLRQAKVEMVEAKKALEQAVGPFDGHRVKAINDLKVAITQIERCLETVR